MFMCGDSKFPLQEKHLNASKGDDHGMIGHSKRGNSVSLAASSNTFTRIQAFYLQYLRKQKN